MRSVTEDLLDLAPLGKFRRLQDSPSENPTEPSNPPRGRHADTVAFKSTGASNRFLMKKYIKVVYPIGSMYAIYDNIYHQYTPNVSIYIYIPYMDPMGTIPWSYFTPVSDIKKNLRMNAPLTFQCPEKHPRKKGEKIVSRECVFLSGNGVSSQMIPNGYLSRDGNQVTHLGPIEVQSGTAPRLPEDAAETGTRLV